MNTAPIRTDYTDADIDRVEALLSVSLVSNRARTQTYPEKLVRVPMPAAARARVEKRGRGDGFTTVSVHPREYARLVLLSNNDQRRVRDAMYYAAQLLDGFVGKNFSGAVRLRATRMLEAGWQPGITEDDALAAQQARENNAAWEV